MPVLQEIDIQIQRPPVEETFGRSLSMARIIGNIVCRDQASLTFEDQERLDASLELGYDDFVTAVTEMLKTDEEYGNLFDIENQKRHPVVGGQVCSASGRPLLEVARAGALAAAEEAEVDRAMEAEALRGQADLRFIEEVNALQVGESISRVTPPPKEELKLHPEIYHDVRGYRDHLTYLHSAVRIDEETVIFNVFSIDGSDLEILRTLFARHGVEVPEEVSANEWGAHYLRRTNSSGEEQLRMDRQFRGAYYELAGVDGQRFSMNDYVATQKHLLETRFKVYYKAHASAVAQGKNNEVLKGFASALLDAPLKKMDPDLRRQLVKIANTDSFNDQAGRDIDSLLRYAAAEELRGGISDYVKNYRSRNSSAASFTFSMPSALRSREFIHADMGFADLSLLHKRTAMNISNGVEAERGYGGCPGQIKFTKKSSAEKELESLNQVEEEIDNVVSMAEAGGKKKGSSETLKCRKCHAVVKKKHVVQKDFWTGEEKNWCCPLCRYTVDVCTGKVTNEGTASPDENKKKHHPKAGGLFLSLAA